MPNTEGQSYAVLIAAAVVIAGFGFMIGTQRTAGPLDSSSSGIINQLLSTSAERSRLQTESQDRNMQTLIEQNKEMQNLVKDLNRNLAKLSENLQSQSTVAEETRKLALAFASSHKELKLMSSELSKHFTTMADHVRHQTELQEEGIKVAVDQTKDFKSALSNINNNLQTVFDQHSTFIELERQVAVMAGQQQTLNETAETVLNKTKEFLTEKLVEPIAEFLHWTATQRESVAMLPVSSQMVVGIALLNDELYVVRDRSVGLIEVYSTNGHNYTMQRRVSIPGALRLVDLTSCPQKNSIYAADDSLNTIYRIDTKGKVSEWFLDEKPKSLSATKSGNILVLCSDAEKLIEFTPDGVLVQEIYLQTSSISLPRYAVELSTGRYLVSHGTNRLSVVGADGRILQRGSSGIGNTYHNIVYASKGLCFHLAVVNNTVIALDFTGKEVIMLNAATLEYTGSLVSFYRTLRGPYRVAIDLPNRKLYVADNRYNKEQVILDQGTVKVFTIENDIML